jgi:hypothetical protein
MPLVVTALAPSQVLIFWVSGTTLAYLALMGAVAAAFGSADDGRGAVRVAFWGALALEVTTGAGALFGTVV